MKRRIWPVLLALTLSACAKAEPMGLPAETAATDVPAVSAVTEEETIPQTAPEESERHYLLTFAGDCTLGTHVTNTYAPVGYIQSIGEDYDFPLANVKQWFEADDLTLVNLECALTDRGNPQEKTFIFRGPPEFVQILTRGGVDAVSLSNNHARDYGEVGYADTKSVLEQVGLSYVERDATALITLADGFRVGLCGGVFYKFDLDVIREQITTLREQGAELVIYTPHWGTEGSYTPEPGQEMVGRSAIDAGADIVWGGHPHTLQPIEQYGNGIIYYSLGNFTYGGHTDPDDYDTAFIQQEVIRRADGAVILGTTTPVPCCVSSIAGRNNYQPTPYAPDSENYARVLAKLNWP